MKNNITVQEVAALLSGRKYREELTAEEAMILKQRGIVVVFGVSDDLMELRGAIDDEISCWNGGTVKLNGDGLIDRPQCDDCDDCKYYNDATKGAAVIGAVWCAEEDASWTYETEIKHETFDIIEDGEVYCRGIVFYLCDVGGK